MDGYDVAQICLNGHPINSSTKIFPEGNKQYCPECGEKTITACLECNTPIEGKYHETGVFDFAYVYRSPKFCKGCGNPFPWTKARIEAARELAEFQLPEEDSLIVQTSLSDLVQETPRTTLAAAKFKKIISKAGQPFADGIRDILVDVLSEAVKKSIWP